MTRYLIIGDGAAGTTAAQYIRRSDREGDIAIYSDDPNSAYYRAALTNYLIGELREDQIWAVPPSFYQENSIRRVPARVARVEPEKSRVVLSDGKAAVTFDRLLIATGSEARQPRFENADLPGVMTMRTLQDVRRVMDLVKLHGLRHAVVVGGGPLALEWAHGLHERGVHVTVLLRGDHFMRGALDKTCSDIVLARLRMAGVEVRLNDEIETAIPDSNGNLSAVQTRAGAELPCELAGVAIGVVCNSKFLEGSGLALNRRGAVIVDAGMRTELPDIYAAGDIAEVHGRMQQLWEPARLQGRVAGMNMAGGDERFESGALYNATRLFDLDFAGIGAVAAEDGAREMIDMPMGGGRLSYRKLILKDGVLIGAMMLGARDENIRRQGRLYKQAIDQALDLSGVEDDLLSPEFDLNSHIEKKRSLQPTSSQLAGARMTLAALRPETGQIRKTFAARKPRPVSQPAAAAIQPASAPAGAAGAPHIATLGLATQALQRRDVDQRLATAFLSSQNSRWELDQVIVIIGRDPENAISIADSAASHKHAQITLSGSTYYLQDLGSTNGTRVNDTPVTAPHPLAGGDRIRIGRTIFEVGGIPAAVRGEEAAAVESPPAEEVQTDPQKYCRNCGGAMAQVARFCPHCGTPWDAQEPAAAVVHWVLILTMADGETQEHALTGGVLIGRSKQCDLVVPDSAISGRHLELRIAGPAVEARDLGSTNGSRYGDRKMGEDWIVLDPGAPLVLGSRVELRVERR